MEELLGKTIARYQILALLGEGGMGAVFKAYDLTLQRDVAIKVMHKHFARQSDFKERFLQEARIAARLDHPCIVQVFDFGQTNSMLYIVMKYIPGDDLSKMLQELQRQGTWIDLSEAVQLVRLVAEALHYAHQHAVLHRDIKPGNIMIEPVPYNCLPYRPVLTDLGLAKLVGSQAITQEGSSMGTPAYMSPEQALGQPLDARSDVYSLGILLYEMVTGRLPFPARTISEAIRYHTQEAPPLPRSIQPGLPESLEKVILKALAKKPEERYQDAAVFSKVLGSALPTDATSVGEPTALAGSVSLITQYQQSLSAGRGPSIFKEFAQPVDLKQDRVQVLFKEKTIQTVTMKKGGVTIGRDADNDIVITNPGVSRHHARIDFDGKQYRVMDLDSTNGTFMDGNRLLPGIPEDWAPERLLKIDDAYFRLLIAEKIGARSFSQEISSQVDPNQIISSPGGGSLGVLFEASQLTAIPGQCVTLPVLVVNQGEVVEHVRISLDGVPGSWATIRPSSLQLMPATQQSVTLTIQPPRASQSRAGRYPITVCVASQASPNQVIEAKGTLTVTPFVQFASELYPQRLRASAMGRVTVQNQGNLQETFTLAWRDRADELEFRPQQTRLNIPAGQESIAEFQAIPRRKTIVGGEQIYPITVKVSDSQGELQTMTGEVVSRGWLPVWLLPWLIFLCLLLSVSGALIYRNKIDQVKVATQSAATLIARQVEAVQTSNQAAIHTMNARQTALRAAALAESATVAALSATPIPSLTDTPQPTLTPTPSPVPTATPTPSPVPTLTPTISPSPSLFDVRLTIVDAGKTVELKTGDTFQVTLEGNPSTGYTWVMATQGSTIIQQVGEPEYSGYTNMPGSAGLVTLKFMALASGQAVLRLEYKQPWMSGVEPEKTYEVTLVVK